jgi:hypothetical protein
MRTRGLTFFVLSAATAFGCSSNTPRIVSDYISAGSHRLGQLLLFAPASDLKELHDLLLAAGAADAQNSDQSVAMARIVCCGGPNEKDTARTISLPSTLRAGLGYVVEYCVGRPAKSEGWVAQAGVWKAWYRPPK